MQSVSLRSIACALAVLGMGCSDDATPSGGTAQEGGAQEAGAQDGGAQDGATPVVPGGAMMRATIDGEVVEFAMLAGTIGGLNSDRFTIAGTTTTPMRNLTFGGGKNVVGTTACTQASGQAMGYTTMAGEARASSGGECSITVTEVPAAAGGFWAGTFTGRLMGNGGIKATITEGTFRVPRK